nr:hypothetical protein CFP56_51128 [Quercus suber]
MDGSDTQKESPENSKDTAQTPRTQHIQYDMKGPRQAYARHTPLTVGEEAAKESKRKFSVDLETLGPKLSSSLRSIIKRHSDNYSPAIDVRPKTTKTSPNNSVEGKNGKAKSRATNASTDLSRSNLSNRPVQPQVSKGLDFPSRQSRAEGGEAHGLGKNSACDQVDSSIPSNKRFQPSFNLSHPQDGSAEVLPDTSAGERSDKGDGEAN